MSATDTIYDAWGNRASNQMHTMTVNGSRVYKAGGYTITVPDDHDEPAKIAHEYRSWGRSENPMPNMSFSDGEMRIPVEDFADLILRRVPAVELAEGLWRDDEVRERFIECMSNRWGGDGIEDKDRRSLLNKIQVAIHAKAIDRAIERLNRMESNARSFTDRYRWGGVQNGFYSGLYEAFKSVLYEMREAGLLTDEQVLNRIERHITPEKVLEHHQEGSDPVVKESVGKQWHESRDYWRRVLIEAFPEPTEPATPTP